MARINRREFLRMAGLGAVGSASQPVVDARSADRNTGTRQACRTRRTSSNGYRCPGRQDPGEHQHVDHELRADNAVWVQMLQDMAKSFKDKTSISVDIQLQTWDVVRPKLLLINQAASILTSPTSSGSGPMSASAAASMALCHHRVQVRALPDLETRFSMSAMQDGFYLNDFYGPVYRGDPRTLIYRNDALRRGHHKSPRHGKS